MLSFIKHDYKSVFLAVSLHGIERVAYILSSRVSNCEWHAKESIKLFGGISGTGPVVCAQEQLVFGVAAMIVGITEFFE